MVKAEVYHGAVHQEPEPSDTRTEINAKSGSLSNKKGRDKQPIVEEVKQDVVAIEAEVVETIGAS